MVEGNLDVKYFSLASELYLKESGKHLLGADLAVFSPGSGDAGGTRGILDKFPTLWNLASLDVDRNGKRRFRVACLFDNDVAGRKALELMCNTNRTIHRYGGAYLLNRELPRRSRESKPLSTHIADANQRFGDLPCEVEDLIARHLCDLYRETYPQHLIRRREVGTAVHSEWTLDGKDGLFKFAKTHADTAELAGLIDAIKSIRYYLALPPDGVSN